MVVEVDRLRLGKSTSRSMVRRMRCGLLRF